ncbi:carboxypeptidase-like regulatory domain-containing protein [Planctomicrobium sp. SH664]|uniref:carboxypeptidase-like regulatory domain-containing protein n=1 Tax=Planctomicrobium sp. SH664 TaxID=3448125 RepID=UPI003F5C3F66
MSDRNRGRLLRLVAIAVLISSGCRRDDVELGDVTGRVTLDGKPVPNAYITFTPDGAGRPSTCRSDEEGRYVLRFSTARSGALVGTHQVRVSTADITADDKAIAEIIPARYHRQGSIPVTIEAGRNEINLELVTLPSDAKPKQKPK